jgi:mannose-6-phosphate isomerase-like protein (cupin superfamily)
VSETCVVRLSQAEVVRFGAKSFYQPLLGDSESRFPVRTGIQTCEPGYAAQPHSHPYIEILHILEGTAEAWFEGREHEAVRLEVGDSIVLPVGAVHAFRVVGERRMRLLGTHLSPERIVNYVDGVATDAGGYRRG